MKWPWVSRRAFDLVEREIANLRNDNRILLSSLLERTVSREAALMLRTEDELALSKKSMIDRATVHYEAQRSTGTVEQPTNLRHWRGARSEMETKSAAEVAAAQSNDSVERVQAKVKAAQGA